MYTQTRKNPVLFVAAMLAMVALTSLACTFNGVRVRTNLPVIEITINQDEIDQLILNADINACNHCDHLLNEITRVELHDGFIRYVGTTHLPDRSEVDGSFDMSLGAENGLLKAKIVAVNIQGIDLNHHYIVEANQELEDGFTHMVNHSHGEVLFKEWWSKKVN